MADSTEKESGRLPEVVYHYTSIDTMLKIVKNNCIWATSINYLNDTSEGDHYLGLIRERILKEWIFSHHEVADLHIFDGIVKEARRTFEDRPYVASFSELDDSLPQWRSYCPQGNGVAIGFRTNCLVRSHVKDADLEQAPPHPEKWRFEFFRPTVSVAKIEYIDKTATEFLDRDISQAIEEVKAGPTDFAGNTSAPGEHEEPLHAPARLFAAAIQRRAGFKKSPSFSNESEYRLLVNSSTWNRRLLEFRAMRSALVPFLPVEVPRLVSEPQPLPQIDEYPEFIARVVIGPTPNMELSRQAVSAFLLKEGLKKAVVKPSEIPYRDW
jgi:Protein of unknown function (DUF2971)